MCRRRLVLELLGWGQLRRGRARPRAGEPARHSLGLRELRHDPGGPRVEESARRPGLPRLPAGGAARPDRDAQHPGRCRPLRGLRAQQPDLHERARSRALRPPVPEPREVAGPAGRNRGSRVLGRLLAYPGARLRVGRRVLRRALVARPRRPQGRSRGRLRSRRQPRPVRDRGSVPRLGHRAQRPRLAAGPALVAPLGPDAGGAEGLPEATRRGGAKALATPRLTSQLLLAFALTARRKGMTGTRQKALTARTTTALLITLAAAGAAHAERVSIEHDAASPQASYAARRLGEALRDAGYEVRFTKRGAQGFVVRL